MKCRIRYAEGHPWSILKQDKNGTRMEGVVSDLYDSMIKYMNFKCELIHQSDNNFGTFIEDNKTWTGIAGSIARNETDYAGPYMMSKDYSEIFDFSPPIQTIHVGILTGLVPANRKPFLLFKLFNIEILFPQVWILLFLCFCLVSGILTILDIKHKKTLRLQTFFINMWNLLGILFGKGAITSAFSSDKLKPRIESLEELAQSTDVDVMVYKGSKIAKIVKNLKSPLDSIWQRAKHNQVPYNEMPEYFQTIEEGKKVLIASVPNLKERLKSRSIATNHCKLRIIPLEHEMYFAIIAMRKGIPQEKFKKSLLRYIQAGLVPRAMIKYTHDYDKFVGINEMSLKALEFKDVQAALLLWIIGISVSLISFLIERILYIHRKLIST